MHFEIPQTVFVSSGERNPLNTLGLAFSQPLVQLMAWAHTTEQPVFQKTKSLETSASQKNPRSVNTQEKHSGRKQTALENREKTETQLELLSETANEIFTDVRVKRNHVVQHYHSVRSRYRFQDYSLQKIHFQGCQVTLLFNLVSHLCQTYLKTERLCERCHYA